MSGSDLPYHLRPNKAIDRNLFIALLERVGRVTNISDYEYIGFGGPMLEDYKALHAALRIRKMHSIERNENTYRRQRFNRPAGFVTLHSKESSEFFRTHQYNESGSVVWLDYTDMQLKSQLDELTNVASNLTCFDVIKITMNANVANLKCDQLPIAERAEARMKIFQETLDGYAPADLEVSDFYTKKYPSTLQRCVKNALSTLPTKQDGRYFQILSSFVYADNQPMLTVTGIIFKTPARTALAHFKRQSRIQNWPFANINWAPPQEIAVPGLTAKERIHLDGVLPFARGTSGQWNARLEKHLGYSPSSQGGSLGHYARYYREYPHFARVAI